MELVGHYLLWATLGTARGAGRVLEHSKTAALATAGHSARI